MKESLLGLSFKTLLIWLVKTEQESDETAVFYDYIFLKYG